MTLKKIYPQIVALAFFLFAIGISSVIAQKVWTLEQCVNYALKNNIQIKQMKLQTQIAETNL